ncbi:MAG: hypothetical protein QM778_28330 [Myxococcales bacterium]
MARASFRQIRLDDLYLQAPVHLAASEDGGVVAVYHTGEVVHYDTTGGRREIVLPVLPRPHLLPDKQRYPVNIWWTLILSTFNQPPSLLTRILSLSAPDMIPWNQLANDGERVTPVIFQYLLRDRSLMEPRTPSFGGREPADAYDHGVVLEGCANGGLVVGDGETLFVLRKQGQSWRRISGFMESNYRPSSCSRHGDALEIALENPTGTSLTLRVDATDHAEPGAPHPSDEPAQPLMVDGFSAETCSASDGVGGRQDYAWTNQSGQVSLYHRDGRSWLPLAQLADPARISCQLGGVGVFVATDQGLDLLEPAPAVPLAVAARNLRNCLLELHPVPEAPYQPRPVQAALLPNWMQFIFEYADISERGHSNILAGGASGTRTTWFDTLVGRPYWQFDFYLEWTLDDVFRNPSMASEGIRRLSALPQRMHFASGVSMECTDAKGAGVRQAAHKQVLEAVRSALAAAPP